MTRHDIGLLATKLLGAYLFLSSLWLLEQMIYELLGYDSPLRPGGIPSLVLTSVLFSLFAGAGVYLFFFPSRFASLLLPETKTDDPVSSVTGRELQQAGFSIVGLVLVVYSIPTVIAIILRVFWSDAPVTGPLPRMIIDLLIALLKISLGAWLLFDSNGIIEIINRVRTAGLKRPNR